MSEKFTFVAYTTDTPFQEALQHYRKKIRRAPIFAIAPPGYPFSQSELETGHSTSVSALMLTHQEVGWRPSDVLVSLSELRKWNESDTPESKEEGVKVRAMKRAVSHSSLCPHCGSRISTWENLGWWDWGKRGDPSYWPALREYVLKRDDYICQSCGDQFNPVQLSAHHVIPKGAGGTDSAENLMTVCRRCHNAIHDYYDGLIQKGLAHSGTPHIPMGRMY